MQVGRPRAAAWWAKAPHHDHPARRRLIYFPFPISMASLAAGISDVYGLILSP